MKLYYYHQIPSYNNTFVIMSIIRKLIANQLCLTCVHCLLQEGKALTDLPKISFTITLLVLFFFIFFSLQYLISAR